LAKLAKIPNIYLPVKDLYENNDSVGKISHHKFKRNSGSKLSSSEDSVFSNEENNEQDDKDCNRVSYL